MHNVQKSSDFNCVAQLSDCVVATLLYFLSFHLVPDHSCVCALSIFAFGELPKNSRVCLRRNSGMHGRILTTNNEKQT